MNFDKEKLARRYNPELREQDEEVETIIKTIELMKKYEFDKTLKDLAEDDN